MKSTVFSAVAVSIGYILLGWDFTTVLGNSFTGSLALICHGIQIPEALVLDFTSIWTQFSLFQGNMSNIRTNWVLIIRRG
jgi:hypothetical protein